jgi:hypothetical protein
MRSSVVIFALLAGCSHPGDENLGISTRATSYAIDVGQLTKPEELLRAVGLPGREVDKRIGAHRLEASSALKIEAPGRAVETLDETWLLDSDGKGALRVVHENNRGGGNEAVVTAGELYVRPRYGRFVRRRPEGDEVDRLRAQTEGVAADYLGLVERWLQVREDGHIQVAGRPGLKLKLSATASPAPGPKETDPGRRWRESVAVRYVDGDVVLDAASGALLAARLEASYTFEREGVKGPFAVTLSYKQTGAAPEAIAAPADAVSSPHRTRPMLDRQELLEGLTK